jgi:hypothetical protein
MVRFTPVEIVPVFGPFRGWRRLTNIHPRYVLTVSQIPESVSAAKDLCILARVRGINGAI